MAGFFDHFPDSWKVPAKVIRGGGRDDWGELQPTEEIPRKWVLIGKGTTVEANSASSLVETTMKLYDPDTKFQYQPTDQIEVPDGHMNSGKWAVAGLPFQWPFGSEVPLERA